MANTVDIHYGGAVILSVMPDDSSYSYEELMARDQLVLNFSLADYVEIPVGAWVEHGGKRYTLLASGAVTMHHTRNWEYSLTLEAGIGHLGKYIVHNTTDTDRRVRFDLTDKASRHIKLLVDNLNERDGDGTWSAGQVLTDETDTEKLVTYSQSTILEALNAIADAYGTEWSVSSVISGGVEKHTLTLGKVEKNTGADALTLAYGSARVGGLNSGIARNNAREDFAISRLFVQGGERNVALNMQYAGSEYGSKTLLLPKDANFLFDGQKFSDEEGYDETKGVRFVTDTEGRYVEVYGAASDAAEGSYDGSDTYPMRIGTVSAVSTTPSKGDEAFVNIEDDTLGSAEGKEAIDYSALGITGEQFTMVFQTGALAGKEFGVNSYKLKADCGYFELAQETIDGVVMPQVPGKAFAPKAGDKYAVFGMKMPDAYIAAAQKEMLRLAAASLYVYRNAQFTLRDSINQQWAKRYWTELALGTKFVIGGYVKYYNEALFPDAEGHIYTSRITAVKRGLNNPYDIELTVSDKPGTRTVASEFKRIDDGEVHGKEERDGIIQYTKRSLRDTLETAEALMESKLAGYGDAISPIVVRTMQMIAGDETLQFDLWTDRTCTTRAASVFAYDDSSKVFSASSCALRHLTIGIDDIAPLSSRKTEGYLRWTMSAFESAALTDSEARYYLYARVNASNNGTDGTDGTFVLSAAAIDKDAESGWWHLLVGILNRENDGTRSFVTVYGFTEVLPGQITTDIIRSADGRSFLNLLLNKFHLGDDAAYIDWNNFILNGLKIKGDVEADTLKLNGKKDSSGKTTVTADINGLMAMRGTDGEDITAFLNGVYGDGVIFGAAASDAFAKSLAFAEQEDDLDIALRPDFLLYRKDGKVKVYIKDLDSETTISLNAAVFGLQQQMSGKLDKSVFDKLFTVHYKEGSATEIESLELNYGTWTTGFLSARGLDDTTGSGSGGTDLPAVWESLTKNVMPYQDVTINAAHIPVLPQSKVTGLPDALSSLRLGYTGISALIPQAATADNQLADKEFVNSSIATATATFRGTFATLEALKATPADRNDYAFWAHKDADGNTCYDKYTYDGSVWKFEYRLNNSSFTAAQWGAINSGITGTLVTKLSGIATGAQVNVIETVKLGGTALAVSGKAVDITGTGIKSALGISDWALAASKPSYTTAEVTEKTNLYYTDARVKAYADTLYLGKSATAAAATKLANSRKLWGNAFNGEADVNGDITLGSGKRIYFGSTSYYIELVNGSIHTNVGLYSDKFISARDVDPDAGGGSGASLPVVWASLQGNTDDYKNETIHQAHIPVLPVSRIAGLATALAGKQPLITADNKLDYSLLKNTPTIGNGTITIKQGTNSQTFSTNQGDNKTITLTDTTYESKTAASGGTALSLVTTGEKYTWNNKQAAISDLATIRSNAATAFGWGDHSKAGYLKTIATLTINGTAYDGTTPTTVNFPTSLPANGGNADTVDGLHASSFAQWKNCDNVDTAYDFGFWRMLSTGSGAPTGKNASQFITVPYRKTTGNTTPDFAWQIFAPNGDDPTHPEDFYVRTGLSKTWNPWRKLYHSGNFIDGTDYISPKTTLGGYGIEDWIVRYTADSPDTFKTAGIYRVSTVGTSGDGYYFNYGQVLVLRGTTSSDTISQIAAPYDNKNLYFRSGTVSTFTDADHPWRLIYNSGNCNKSDVDWNAANLTVENRVRIKNANVIAFLSTDAMPKERLLGPMSSYDYDLAWHNGVQWNKVYHAGNSNLSTVPWKCSSLIANGSVEAKANLYGQSLEFLNIASSAGHGGFIDFHFNGSTANYTSRIIESASGKLHLVASLVRIGNGPSATFAMSGTSYDYIWTEYPGAALILGTADGGGTNSSNSAIFIKGKKVYIGGTETGNNALNVKGVAHATTGIYTDGYVSARGQDTSSDIRLKTDFRPIAGALEYIMGTHFTRFRWKDGSGESVGIIAQEEQSREYGFLVRSHGEIGHLTYDYAASTALLGAALQEEDEKVEALKRRVKELENKLDRLKQSNYAN